MRSFRDLVTEQKETIVFTFGRFNPPTTGHEKLIKKVASVAGSNPFRIYPSHTTNPKKDPLPHSLKVAYMRKMFKRYSKNIIADKKMKTAIMIAEALYQEGFKNLIMVVGSDRVQEFQTLLSRYNDAPDKSGKQLFKFDTVKVVSAGERDPDAEGVEGMSASKMRAAAADGDKDSFLTGLPSGFRDGEKLYRDVRKYMGIREERDMGDMTDFENVRDMFLTGKIWNAGDVVEANGVIGEVVRKGTNYLSFVDKDGKVHKAWLHEITLNEITFKIKNGVVHMSRKEYINSPSDSRGTDDNGAPTLNIFMNDDDEEPTALPVKFVESVELDERNYRKEYDNYHSRPEQIARRSSRNQARRIMGDKTKINMDVGHKDNDPMNNSPENLRNEDPSKNRREPRLREMDEDLTTVFPWLGKAKDYLFTKTHKQGLNKVAIAVATEYAKQKKAGKNPKTMQIIHNISKNIRDVSDRMVRDYVNDLVKQGKLPKELEAEYEVKNETMSFKDFVNQIQLNEKLGKNADAGDYIDDFMKSDAPQFKGKSKEKIKKMAIAAYLDKKDKSEGAYGYEKQDPDIKGKGGTQPAKYYKGMSKSTKQKRDAHFKSKKKGPAPGDATGETKPSVHTKKFKQMYGEQKMDCPPATQNLAVNTKNRDTTIKKYNYGPLNVDEPGDYWKNIAKYWKTTETAAKKSVCANCVAFDISPRIKECLPGDTFDDDGELGYCWMHHFKCHSARACHTWAKGGPIKVDKESHEWQERAFGKKESLGEAPRIPRKKGQPAGSDKHSDLYTDENPVGTIHGLGFKDVETAKASVKKIIGSGKTHAHKIQAAIAMEQRAKEMGKTAEAAVYRKYIEKMKKKTKEMQKNEELDESLWANIHKKRQRIKRGSGEKMRKKGEKGAPTPAQMKRAKGEEIGEKAPDTSDAMKRYKAGKAGFTDIAHLKAKGLIKRADGEKKKSPKYEEVCCEECETESLIIKENIYRVGSEAYFKYFVDLREKFESGELYYKGFDKRLMEGDIGKFAMYEGEHVPLDCPMMEAEYQGKEVELNKPKAGGPKKYYVYVKDPSTGNVKKVSWGDTTGLKIKLDDKAARKSFAARHKCDQQKDKTTASYWACNMPRYADQLGLSGGGNFFW